MPQCTRQPADLLVLQALKKVDEEDFFARFTYVVSWLLVAVHASPMWISSSDTRQQGIKLHVLLPAAHIT